MKLKDFKVSGFKCLENIDWIPIKKLILFTGQNDGGKTSVIYCLKIFLGTKNKPQPSDFTLIGPNQYSPLMSFEGKFELTDEEKALLRLASNEAHIKKEISYSGETKYLYKTRVHRDPRFHNLKEHNVGPLEALANEYRIPISQRRRTKEETIKEITDWLSTQQLEEGWLPVPTTVLEGLPELKIFESAGPLDPQTEITSTLRNSFSSLVKNQTYSGRLSEISAQIEVEMKEDVQMLIPIIKSYCPDVVEAEVQQDFDFSNGFKYSRLRLKKHNESNMIELDDVGEGQKRRITLAVYEWREKLFEAPAHNKPASNRSI